MKLVWLKSNMPLSVLIRYGLGIDCSHFAIVFESPAGGLMFESNLLGTHPKFFRTALSHATLVHEMTLPMTSAQEDEVWDTVVGRLDNAPYNYGAFAFFAWRGLLRRLLSIPLPRTNPWSKPGADLCTQVFDAVKPYTALRNYQFDLSMTDPHMLYEMLVSPPALGAA